MDSNSQSLPNGDPSIVLSSKSESGNEKLPEPFKVSQTPLGPTPHVIHKTSEIVEQRLRKRIRKLTEQRDDARKRIALLTEMIKLYPYLDSRWEAYKERQENAKRLREYDTMVPLLIRENENLKRQVEALQKIT